MNAQPKLDHVELRAASGPRHDEILTPEALAFLAELHRRFDARRLASCSPAAPSGRSASTPARCPIFWPRPAPIREADWKVAPIPGRSARPPRRDHRPRRPQDDHQRAQFRRQGVHGRFRGRQLADLGQMIEGQINLQRPLGGDDRLHRRGDRQAYELGEKPRRADGAPARLAPRRAARAGRRRANVGLAVRFRPLLLPQRQGADRPGLGALLLSAEDGEPSRGAAVERRVRFRRGAARRSRTGRSRPPC